MKTLLFLLISLSSLNSAEISSLAQNAKSLLEEHKTQEVYDLCSPLDKNVLLPDFDLCLSYSAAAIVHLSKKRSNNINLTGDEMYNLGWAIGFMDRMSFANPDNNSYKNMSNIGASALSDQYFKMGNETLSLLLKLSVSLRP